MKQYETRRTVEAVQFDGTPAQAADIIEWARANGATSLIYDNTEPERPRLSWGFGAIIFEVGDWVVITDDGEFKGFHDEQFQRMFKETGL